jgi:hypothetical protein
MMSWIMLGVLVFILPLWGAHRQLDETKDRALEGNARSYKTAIDELHHAVSTKTLDKIDAWQTALSALDLERRHLDRLATWPWSPGALRNLLAALVLPILVWILQYGIQQLIE